MKRLFFVLGLGLLSSCSNYSNNITTSINSVNKSTTNSVSFKFSLKATSAQRIKSVSAYLSNNYNNPDLAGSNPLGDNNVLNVNVINGVVTFSFKNIPVGGPYYCILSAYDTSAESTTGNNITNIDNTVLSSEKRIARSSNGVTVTPSGLVFSDGGTKLNLKLKLKPTNGLGTEITPGSGAQTSGGITIISN